jgi:hypothetical protein
LPAPTSLPHALPPIPAPQDRDYPGVIAIQADLTDLDHRVIRVRQTFLSPPAIWCCSIRSSSPGTTPIPARSSWSPA